MLKRNKPILNLILPEKMSNAYLKNGTLFTTSLLFASLSFFSMHAHAQNYNDPEIKAKAARIHAAALTLDTHGDLPNFMVNRPDFDISKEHDPYKTGSRIDLPRMKKGGLDAMFFAVYLGQGPRTAEGYADAKKRALAQFELIHGITKKHADLAGLATTPEDAYRLEKEGKRALFIGVENGWTIGKDLSLLQTYYDLGARYMTLTHTRNNDICDSSTDEREHGGLTPFGIEVVKEMNRIGMLVDVSHISDESFYDCLKYSKAPIVATHSSARALFDHPRNLTDEMIKDLAAKGGVIQMNMLGSYLKSQSKERLDALAKLRESYPNTRELTEEQRASRAKELEEINKNHPEEPATLQLVVDHIDHIVKLVGVDHVGIGPDLDGGGGVQGMYDVSEMGNITYELVKRGYSEEAIHKIWSGNFFRVMKEAQRVAATLKN
jgi:membrane dipeptidase